MSTLPITCFKKEELTTYQTFAEKNSKTNATKNARKQDKTTKCL